MLSIVLSPVRGPAAFTMETTSLVTGMCFKEENRGRAITGLAFCWDFDWKGFVVNSNFILPIVAYVPRSSQVFGSSSLFYFILNTRPEFIIYVVILYLLPEVVLVVPDCSEYYQFLSKAALFLHQKYRSLQLLNPGSEILSGGWLLLWLTVRHS